MTVDPSHTVYITTITSALMQVLAALILGLGTWAISRFTQWLGLKNAAQVTANLDDSLQKGVTYGLQQTLDLIKQKGWDSIEVRNEALSKAVPYVIGRFPDALKATGIDMTKQADLEAKVEGALNRAFPHAAAIAAASPSTPPATSPSPQRTADLANRPHVTTTLVENTTA